MILALDLSTKSSGWAVYDKNNLITSGCITATSSDLIERIIKITKELEEKILKKYNIHEVIAEEVQPTGGYGVGNQKTHKALMWIQASIPSMRAPRSSLTARNTPSSVRTISSR